MAIITSTININASAEKVFEALTQPELVKLWQYGRVPITDWKEGSEILFRTEWEGNVLEQKGSVLEMRTNELVKYNLFTPRPGVEDSFENYATTSYVLKEEKGLTKVDIVQEDQRPNAFVAATLLPILVALKKVVEGIDE